MRNHIGYLLLCLAPIAAPLSTRAATVWTGPRITRGNTDGVDQITPSVGITRGGSQGIYNISQEAAFSHFFSPADTQWADGTTANYSSLSYTDWNTWAKGVHSG